MDKLRSGEFTRRAGSFLLAVGLHALFLLIQGSGYWGASGDELGYTIIQPRLVELETVRREATTQQRVADRAPARPKPPAPSPEAPPAQEEPAPPPVEKPLTTIEEVHQEKPAPRETQPEPGEVAPELEVMTSGEETATESGANTNDEPVASEEAVELEAELAGEGDGEAESEEPTVPALPPLGQAGGMVGFFPRSPSYPKGAQHLGVEGRVLVEFYLTPEGTYLKEPLILVPSGHRVLDEHCQQIITKGEWRFKPAAQPYKLQVEIGYANNEVTIEFLGEAAYLSTEEGGELIEQ